VAYTMAKYGMSMCVLGMAEEFKGKVAVNALWPKTAVATAAISNVIANDAMMNACRTPQIMADAAHAILTKGVDFSGNFVVDEDLLRAEGTEDFEQYAVKPGTPLLPDFFL
jgi:citronellol/citronellal dehydrogenase